MSSYATRFASEDGCAVRYARGFWYLFSVGRQGPSDFFMHTMIQLIGWQSLFAYHIEALVPSSPHTAHGSQTPQKLNGTKDVHFFTVGNLGGRTLVIYMKKKGVSLYGEYYENWSH
jgi:hypothetical protein